MTVRLALDGVGIAYGDRTVLADLALDVAAGRTTALVGDSGAGKSTLALALLGLLPPAARLLPGSRALLDGEDLFALDPAGWRARRGRIVSIVFQDPLAALNPVLTIGAQVAEVARLHGERSAVAARRRAVTMLDRLGLDDAERRAAQYPHQLSGGMRQRAMLAMALLHRPALLVADEPTTALDVTVQAHVLARVREIQREDGVGVLLITHDPGVVATHADQVAVLAAGRIVERGPVADVLTGPRAPATRALLECAPRLDAAHVPPHPLPVGAPLLVARHLVKHFPLGRPRPGAPVATLPAVQGVSLTVHRGETVAVVGESGCGKSTLALTVLRLTEPTAGDIRFDGDDLRALRPEALRRVRRRMQVVFQDASAALDPRLTVAEAVAEGIEAHALATGAAVGTRVHALLVEVGLSPTLADRRPWELSGGERQRVALARALATDPELLVLDEAVSSLDASAQGQVLALLARLQRDRGLAMLFITHNLGVVARLAHRVAVMYLGRIVEVAPAAAFLSDARMPYTRALLDAVPDPDPRRARPGAILPGDVPRAATLPPGCVFQGRCTHPARDAECARSIPPLTPVGDDHLVACLKTAPPAGAPAPTP